MAFSCQPLIFELRPILRRHARLSATCLRGLLCRVEGCDPGKIEVGECLGVSLFKSVRGSAKGGGYQFFFMECGQLIIQASRDLFSSGREIEGLQEKYPYSLPRIPALPPGERSDSMLHDTEKRFDASRR